MPSTLHNNIGNDNEKFVMPLKRKNGQTNQVIERSRNTVLLTSTQATI